VISLASGPRRDDAKGTMPETEGNSRQVCRGIRFRDLNGLGAEEFVLGVQILKRHDRVPHFAASRITNMASDLYEVESFNGTGRKYQVDLRGRGTCECPDFVFRGMGNGFACKHILAARAFRKTQGEQ